MDRDADFSTYVAARWPDLVRAAVLLGCSRPEAEDVTQTALARCYSSWGRVCRAGDRDAYVYRTLVNCWAKSRRRRWTAEVPTEQVPELIIDDTLESRADLRHDLLQALRRLSNAHRVVLVLRFVTDMTVPEIAHVLRLPVGTVKSRLSRALAELRLSPSLEETT